MRRGLVVLRWVERELAVAQHILVLVLDHGFEVRVRERGEMHKPRMYVFLWSGQHIYPLSFLLQRLLLGG